ncbi:MAG TPA: putative nucleotidyltransferase substrate binding domain-containing protein [Candidatus Krumholzibacteria bacterium]|nr:putative nucleotidyltransferase substrate binding domain-containing protein [Candidatus Krumholzibacteria bacterium]
MQRVDSPVPLPAEAFHHLPVEREGEVGGLVTHSDPLRHHVNSPAFVLRRVLRDAEAELGAPPCRYAWLLVFGSEGRREQLLVTDQDNALVFETDTPECREYFEGLDLKATGVMPIFGLARVYGLESGSRERSTLERLAAARDKGTLSHEGADLLAEGFRSLLQLRLRRQLEAVRRGDVPDDRVRMEELQRVDARHLKETLLEIRSMQQALAQRHRVELLG